MKKFTDWLKEHEILTHPSDSRRHFEQTIARLSHLEPDEISDMKEILLELQTMLNDKLTGL